MKNKTALITGSSSGIGLSLAHSFAKSGMDIALHGILSQTEGQALAQEFEQRYQVKTFFSDADLRDPIAIEELVKEVNEFFGSIDVLINNAGIQYISPIDEFPREKWDDIIAVNLSAAFHTVHHVLPLMKANKWGRIINIASVHGLVASINKAAYVTAKHGLIGFTKAVALESAECGITCNAICPGWVDTDLIAHQIEQYAQLEDIDIETAKRKFVTQKQAMPEMTAPESLAELALFLCSDAAKTMTGVSLPMDGAWTAQ